MTGGTQDTDTAREDIPPMPHTEFLITKAGTFSPAAVEALVSRIETLKAENLSLMQSIQVINTERARDQNRAVAAERERDEARGELATRRMTTRAHAELLDSGHSALVRSRQRAEVAERRLADTTKALQAFAQGAEAFDRAEGTYGDGYVFERHANDAHWGFTIADVRLAALVLAGVAVVPAPEETT